MGGEFGIMSLEHYEEAIRGESIEEINNSVIYIAEAVKTIAKLYDTLILYSGVTLLTSDFILDAGDTGMNRFELLTPAKKCSLDVEGKTFTYCTGLDICKLYKDTVDALVLAKKRTMEDYALADYMTMKELCD